MTGRRVDALDCMALGAVLAGIGAWVVTRPSGMLRALDATWSTMRGTLQNEVAFGRAVAAYRRAIDDGADDETATDAALAALTAAVIEQAQDGIEAARRRAKR